MVNGSSSISPSVFKMGEQVELGFENVELTSSSFFNYSVRLLKGLVKKFAGVMFSTLD